MWYVITDASQVSMLSALGRSCLPSPSNISTLTWLWWRVIRNNAWLSKISLQRRHLSRPGGKVCQAHYFLQLSQQLIVLRWKIRVVSLVAYRCKPRYKVHGALSNHFIRHTVYLLKRQARVFNQKYNFTGYLTSWLPSCGPLLVDLWSLISTRQQDRTADD